MTINELITALERARTHFSGDAAVVVVDNSVGPITSFTPVTGLDYGSITQHITIRAACLSIAARLQK